MRLKKIYFETEDGVELFGLLHTPENETDEIVIYVHGLTSSCTKKREDIFAEEYTNSNIAFFGFNNRGAEIITRLNQKIDGMPQKQYFGAAYEDVLDSYYDVKAAICEMIKLGYKKIYLKGHSLGCLKVAYTYNKLLKNGEQDILSKIKAVLLLSMVDIYDLSRNEEKNFYKNFEIAESKEKEEQLNYLIMDAIVGAPISVKTYLRYYKYNDEISFPRYADYKYDYKELNNISCPIFMRWGNVNETIVQTAEDLVKIVNDNIINKVKDIGYIDGANHSYNGKEIEIVTQEIKFIRVI